MTVYIVVLSVYAEGDGILGVFANRDDAIQAAWLQAADSGQDVICHDANGDYSISWRMHDVHIIAQEVVPSSK